MTLYIDESGNTGETLSKDFQFNFKEQPYYVLAGILVNDTTKAELENFIAEQKIKYRIQSHELKAKNLYKTKSKFIIDLVNFIKCKQISFYIELMDKLFFLNIYIVEYFIYPYYLPLTNENLVKKNFFATKIRKFLKNYIYQTLIDTIKKNTNESLEIFYDILISHFNSPETEDIKAGIEKTRTFYFERTKINSVEALMISMPIPDENPNKKLIHCLPNYKAFSNLLARVQKDIVIKKIKEVKIIHDEQKEFANIFESIFDTMKTKDTDTLFQKTFISEKVNYNLSKETTLEFMDSKLSALLQISDVISGFAMRFWTDYKRENQENISIYFSAYEKLHSQVNYVIPNYIHEGQ